MTTGEMQKMAWDVWAVYKSWGHWVWLRSRPYKVYVTLPNGAMLAVTLAALIWGALFLAKKRSKRRREYWFEQNESLIPSEDIFDSHMEEKEKLKGQSKSKSSAKSPTETGLLSKLPDAGGGHGEIHKSINRPGEGDASVQHTGSYADLFDRDSDDEADVEELPYLTKDGRDPFEMAKHIPGELKKIQNKITTRELEKRLTDDQRKDEAQARRDQLEQIFKLMQDQKEKFGPQNTDDIEEQMKMYSL